MGITTKLAAPPLATVPAWPGEQPPDEITRGLFGRGRGLMRTHPLATDTLLAAVLLSVSSVWLAGSGFAGLRAAVVQTVLIAPLAVRRLYPSAVFVVTSAIAFAQWLLGFPLLGDAALLVALYTVAAHESRLRSLLATGVLEAGAVMAALRWEPAGTPERSLLFLSATVVAALFAGLTVASGSRYLAWMDERARRLEVERDQQAVIAAAAERTRIARELHDIVSHSLSVVITLADAAAVVSRVDPARGVEAMTEVSEVGRRALTDMRAMLGVLRTDEPAAGLAPQPGIGDLGALVERVRATGLPVDLAVEGTPFPLGAAAELTAYRIVQEALTNTLRHAAARHASVTIVYDEPQVRVQVADDGTANDSTANDGTAKPQGGRRGHGIDGMRERAALHGGTLRAGPVPKFREFRAGLASRSHPRAARVSISVLLADDQPLLRRGFRMILETEDDLTVVAEAGNGEEAVDLARRHAPDVVLMDIRMPGTDGIEATQQITAAGPLPKVLVLTTFDVDEYAFGALRAGASGFLLKDVRPGELVAAIRTVAAGDAVISPRVTRRLLEEYAQVLPLAPGQREQRFPKLDTLTDREREVLIAVARGLSNTEIAASLFVSEATVKSHVGRILSKLALRDRVQVVVLAYEAGLIQPGVR